MEELKKDVIRKLGTYIMLHEITVGFKDSKENQKYYMDCINKLKKVLEVLNS